MAEWNLGPDNLRPTNSYTSIKLTDPVKLRLDDEFSQLKPISIYTKFRNTVEEIPNYPAIGKFNYHC